MARAEMRIRVSIFFDPPELDFRVAPRACRPNVLEHDGDRRGAADHVSPETRAAARSLAAWPVSGTSLALEGLENAFSDRRRPTAPRGWD